MTLDRYMRGNHRRPAHFERNSSYVTVAVVASSALAVAAIANEYLARKAERDNPPTGRFLHVNGVRLHYIEQGEGQPIVLLHGNGSMIQDFVSSGLVAAAAQNHRVIVFDRPGFGHTSRPDSVTWTPEEQADLFRKAFDFLKISDPIVLGHSWGASVAVGLGLRHPKSVGALLLVSGYYYPSFRPDFLAMSSAAAPVIGDILSRTVAPLLSRLMWPGMLAKIFGPKDVPAKFIGFPKEMAVRPKQIRASAAESALLIAFAESNSDEYPKLTMPVTVMAGEDDRLIDSEGQSARLHADIVQSRFIHLAEHGHMVHQTATGSVIAAINALAKLLADGKAKATPQ
jgi:pimeloyl-ACP methyl ester carboxylesterase